MKRDRATGLLTDMLDRLEEGLWPASLVEEVHLFGSYARGALEPGDVDLAVQHTTDDRWLRASLYARTRGRDPYVAMRQALLGRRRGISFQFQGRSSLEHAEFELTLLWRKGEPFGIARQRLAAILANPAAGRAPRDHVLPAYEDIADLVPRPARMDLHRLHNNGAVTISAFPLADAQPASIAARKHLAERWKPHSPLRRAAAAALAHLEGTGLDLADVELQSRYLAPRRTDDDITCFVDLGWHHWTSLERYLDDGQSWFEVLPATARQPLHALHVTPTRT